MTSGPITSWQIEGKQWKFLFSWAPKLLQTVTAAMKLKKCLFLGRKAVTNLDSVLKSRDITLPTKVHMVKAMVFPVVMYECESWIIKKAECQRTDAFELWCWRRLLKIPWTARRSNQSTLKGSQPWIFIEKTDAEAPVLWPPDAKSLMLGKVEGRRRRGWQRMRGWMASPTQWTWVWMNSGRWWWTGRPGMLRFMGSQRMGRDWATELKLKTWNSSFTFTGWSNIATS